MPTYIQRVSIKYRVDGKLYEGTFNADRFKGLKVEDLLYIKLGKNPHKFKVLAKLTMEEKFIETLEKVF